jgi:hypothetical protein
MTPMSPLYTQTFSVFTSIVYVKRLSLNKSFTEKKKKNSSTQLVMTMFEPSKSQYMLRDLWPGEKEEEIHSSTCRWRLARARMGACD